MEIVSIFVGAPFLTYQKILLSVLMYYLSRFGHGRFGLDVLATFFEIGHFGEEFFLGIGQSKIVVVKYY